VRFVAPGRRLFNASAAALEMLIYNDYL